MGLVPQRFRKYDSIIHMNMADIQSEYKLAVKRAVIDFVLGASLKENYKISDDSNEERRSLKAAGINYKHKCA